MESGVVRKGYNERGGFSPMMAVGLKQAKADDSFDFQEVFDELEAGLEDEIPLTTEKR